MRRMLPIIVTALFLVCSPGAQAFDDLTDILEKIKTKERSLKTFTAAFSQTKETPLLRDPLRSNGMIYFDHRGRLLFQITGPSPVMILFKGGELITRYPDLGKVERRYIGSGAVRKYFGIGSTVEELTQQYHIGLIPPAGELHYRLTLVPRDEDMARRIESIEVTIRRDIWLPVSIRLGEGGDDNTAISLDFISINKPLPPGIFRVNIPQGGDDSGE